MPPGAFLVVTSSSLTGGGVVGSPASRASNLRSALRGRVDQDPVLRVHRREEVPHLQVLLQQVRLPLRHFGFL